MLKVDCKGRKQRDVSKCCSLQIYNTRMTCQDSRATYIRGMNRKKRPARRKPHQKAPGRLMIIGGHERLDRDGEILKEFFRMAGGKKAKIAIVSVVTKPP